jgi:hypothetical protein
MSITPTVRRYGSLPDGMNLLTVAQLTREIAAVADEAEPGGSPVPVRRRALGTALFDIALIAPPRCSDASASGLATLFRRAGFTVTQLTVPGDSAAAPDPGGLDDARTAIVIVVDGIPLTGRWLWWVLGRASAVTRRQAFLPLPRHDDAQRVGEFRPRIPRPILALPYIGRSRAVGEEADSLWVVPPGAPPETREAVNLEYWISQPAGS